MKLNLRIVLQIFMGLLLFQNINSQYKMVKNPTSKYGYIGTPIIFNNTLYFQYATQTDNTGNKIYQMAKLNNDSIELISNPTTEFGIYPTGNPIILNNQLYIRYKYVATSDEYELSKIEGNKLVLISNPDFTGGHKNDLIVYKNSLYGFYYDVFNLGNLYRFDGKNPFLNKAPLNKDLVVIDSFIYAHYHDQKYAYIARFNGDSTTLFPIYNWNGASYNGDWVVKYNDTIFFRSWDSINNVFNLAKLDGNKVVKISSPKVAFITEAFAISFKNKLYFIFDHQLACYDGKKITTIPNISGSKDPTNYKPFIFNDNLYLQYRNPIVGGEYVLIRCDGTSLTLVKNINYNDYGYVGCPIVYNNTLFIQYRDNNYKNYLAKVEDDKIQIIPNFDEGSGYQGSPIVFNKKLYISYETKSYVSYLCEYSVSNGLKKINGDFKSEFYPTVVSDYIITTSKVQNIEIWNNLGVRIFAINHVTSNYIDIHFLKPGVYFLVADKNRMTKFIKK